MLKLIKSIINRVKAPKVSPHGLKNHLESFNNPYFRPNNREVADFTISRINDAAKILVVIEGGCIQSVLSNKHDLKVEIMDMDNERMSGRGSKEIDKRFGALCSQYPNELI